MDPSSSDDECISVQLNGSDMAPKAMKTILWQSFPTRRYHLESDGQLSNVAKVMERVTCRSLDTVATSCEMAPAAARCLPNSGAADMISQSIAAFLQPHTSSPLMPLIAHTMSSLFASDFGGQDLNQVLSAHLDSLGISHQAKQNIMPALLGIAKLAKLQLQSPSTLISLPSSIVPEPEPVGNIAESSYMSTTPYQMCQQSFSSNSGSGYTVWYFGKSNSSILFPPSIPQAKTGHLYIHLDTTRDVSQYWMLGTGNQWQRVSPGAEYPLNHNRILTIHSNGEPSWITWASITTMKTRKEKEIRDKSVQL